MESEVHRVCGRRSAVHLAGRGEARHEWKRESHEEPGRHDSPGLVVTSSHFTSSRRPTSPRQVVTLSYFSSPGRHVVILHLAWSSHFTWPGRHVLTLHQFLSVHQAELHCIKVNMSGVTCPHSSSNQMTARHLSQDEI